jgi:hypothetical protein
MSVPPHQLRLPNELWQDHFGGRNSYSPRGECYKRLRSSLKDILDACRFAMLDEIT